MKVFVVGADHLVSNLFTSKGFTLVPKPEDSEILVFTGGADVDPALYGESPIKGTYCDLERDDEEVDLYEEFGAERIKIGICRGAQFLNVMNGGAMYQDVDRHAGVEHRLFTPKGSDLGLVNSTHHQMMIPGEDAKVVAIARTSRIRKKEKETFISDPFLDDTELVVYGDKDKSMTLCFQPHPEYKHENTKLIFWTFLEVNNTLLKDFLKPQKDVELSASS